MKIRAKDKNNQAQPSIEILLKRKWVIEKVTGHIAFNFKSFAEIMVGLGDSCRDVETLRPRSANKKGSKKMFIFSFVRKLLRLPRLCENIFFAVKARFSDSISI